MTATELAVITLEFLDAEARARTSTKPESVRQDILDYRRAVLLSAAEDVLGKRRGAEDAVNAPGPATGD